MSTKEDAVHKPKLPASSSERLEYIKRELARERRRVTGSAVLSLIVGLIVLGAISFYFAYGYWMLRKLAQPSDLVAFAEDHIQRQIPELRQQLQEETKKNAPKWAEDISKQALDNIPEGRKRLEQYALERFDETATEVIHLTDEQFRKYLRANRDKLDKYFKDLAKNPKLAEEDINELARSMEEQLELDMKLGARQVLETLIEVNGTMRALRADQKLTPEEQNMRRVVMLGRRIQLENLDPGQLSRFPQPQPLPPKTIAGARTTTPATATKDKAAKDKAMTKPAPKPPSETKKESAPAPAEKDKKKDK